MSADFINKLTKKVPDGFFVIHIANYKNNTDTRPEYIISKAGIFKLKTPVIHVQDEKGLERQFISKYGDWYDAYDNILESDRTFIFGFIPKEYIGEKIEEISDTLYNYLYTKISSLDFPLLHTFIASDKVKNKMLSVINEFRDKLPTGLNCMFHLYNYTGTGLNIVLSKENVKYSKHNFVIQGKFYHTKDCIQYDDSSHYGRIYTPDGKHIITKTDPVISVGIVNSNLLLTNYLYSDIILLSKIYFYVLHLDIDEILKGFVRYVDVISVEKYLQKLPEDMKSLYHRELSSQVEHLEKIIKDKKIVINDYLT